jgi:hypothetical protein
MSLHIKMYIVKFEVFQGGNYSGMWRRVDLVWSDVSEERITSIFLVPQKRRFTQDLYSATFQKTAFFKTHSISYRGNVDGYKFLYA